MLAFYYFYVWRANTSLTLLSISRMYCLSTERG